MSDITFGLTATTTMSVGDAVMFSTAITWRTSRQSCSAAIGGAIGDFAKTCVCKMLNYAGMVIFVVSFQSDKIVRALVYNLDYK